MSLVDVHAHFLTEEYVAAAVRAGAAGDWRAVTTANADSLFSPAASAVTLRS